MEKIWFTDGDLTDDLTALLDKIKESSSQAAKIVRQVNELIDSMEAGEGAVGLVLRDPTFGELLQPPC